MSYSFTAPNKTPYAILDDSLDLTKWLLSGETLSSVNVTCPDEGLTISNAGILENLVTWRVAGGTEGKNHEVEVRFNTDSGRRDMRTVLYPVRAR